MTAPVAGERKGPWEPKDPPGAELGLSTGVAEAVALFPAPSRSWLASPPWPQHTSPQRVTEPGPRSEKTSKAAVLPPKGGW